jgi:hypothetical protein
MGLTPQGVGANAGPGAGSWAPPGGAVFRDRELFLPGACPEIRESEGSSKRKEARAACFAPQGPSARR